MSSGLAGKLGSGSSSCGCAGRRWWKERLSRCHRGRFCCLYLHDYAFGFPVNMQRILAGWVQFGAELGLHILAFKAGISTPWKSASSSTRGLPQSGSSPILCRRPLMPTHIRPEMEPMSARPLRCTALAKSPNTLSKFALLWMVGCQATIMLLRASFRVQRFCSAQDRSSLRFW